MNIELSEGKHATLLVQEKPFKENFIFSANGSLVALGNILESKNLSEEMQSNSGSETWLTEESDIYLFGKNKLLSNLILKVPNISYNFEYSIPQEQKGYHSLKLNSSTPFVVKPKKYRHFDSSKKILISFDPMPSHSECTRHCLSKKLSLLIENKSKKIIGWILKNPLDVIVDNYGGEADASCADDITYRIFENYLNTVSDNTCEKFDDDMELVVDLLLKNITKEKIALIKGSKRIKIMENTIADLVDYFKN